MTEEQLIRKIDWADKRCSLKGEPFTETQKNYLKFVFAGMTSENSDCISDVSERNIAIGDYVWYNERIHKVTKVRFDDEFWKNKEIAITDIESKHTVDVSTKNLRYVC